jgi:hypothetical protein
MTKCNFSDSGGTLSETTRLRAGRSEVRIPEGVRSFCLLQKRPHRLWAPSRRRWVPGFFSGGKAARTWCWPPTPIYCRCYGVELYLFFLICRRDVGRVTFVSLWYRMCSSCRCRYKSHRKNRTFCSHPVKFVHGLVRISSDLRRHGSWWNTIQPQTLALNVMIIVLLSRDETGS